MPGTSAGKRYSFSAIGNRHKTTFEGCFGIGIDCVAEIFGMDGIPGPLIVGKHEPTRPADGITSQHIDSIEIPHVLLRAINLFGPESNAAREFFLGNGLGLPL